MLLVLIFAMSNMGLAEMVELVADIPAEEPSMEEPVVAEEAPEEEEGDEIDVPEEEPGEPAEPNEAEQPAPEEGEAPAEAQSVTVEVKATDETTLVAYETIEPEGAYDVSYMWERAKRADGEWTALDETSDVLASDAEDRADYVYRCTVTAGGVSATSEPATYDWGEEPAAEEAQPVVLLDDGFELSQVNSNGPKPTITVKCGENTLTGEEPVVPVILSKTGGGEAVTLNVSVADGTAKYAWSLEDTNARNVFAAGEGSGDGYLGTPASEKLEGTNYFEATEGIKLKWNNSVESTAFTAGTSVDAVVNIYAVTTEDSQNTVEDKDVGTATVKFHVLKDLTEEEVKAGISATQDPEVSDKVYPGQTITVTSTLDKTDYPVKYSVTKGDSLVTPGNDGTWTVKSDSATIVALQATGSTGADIQITATIGVEGMTNQTLTFDYKAVAGATKFQIKDGTNEGTKEKNIYLVKGGSPAATQNADLELDMGPAAKEDDYKAVQWEVSGDKEAYSQAAFVTFSGFSGDSMPVTGKFTGKDLTDDYKTLKVTASELTESSYVTVKATGTYYENGQSVSKPVEWHIYVIEPDDTLTADSIQCTLDKEIIGQPVKTTAAIPDWAKVKISLIGDALKDKPVEFKVSSTVEDSATYLVPAGEEGVFAAKSTAAGANALEDEKEVGITVTVTTGGTTHTAGNGKISKDFKLTIRPTPNKVELTDDVTKEWESNSADNATVVANTDEFNMTAEASKDAGSSALKDTDKPLKLMGKASFVAIDKKAEKQTDLTTESITVPVGQKWSPGEAGLYEITPYATVGEVDEAHKYDVKDDHNIAGTTYYVRAKVAPSKLVVKSRDDQDYVYVDLAGNNAYKLDLLVDPQDEAGKTIKDPYLKGLTWSLATNTSGSTKLDAQYFDDAQRSSSHDNARISIMPQSAPVLGTDPLLKLEAELQVPGHTSLGKGAGDKAEEMKDNVLDRVVIVKAALDGKDIPCDGKRLTIGELPPGNFASMLGTDVVFSNATPADKAKNRQDESVATEITGANYWIAQGTTGTIALDPEKTNYETLRNYELHYSVKPHVSSSVDAEQVSDWITVDKDSGAYNVKAASGAKNALTWDGTSYSTKDYKLFDVDVYAEGFGDQKHTFVIAVVSAPEKMVLKVATDGLDATYQDDDNLPGVLMYNDSTTFTGMLKGPTKGGKEGRTTGPVPEFERVSGGDTSSLKRDVNTDKTLKDSWTLKNTSGDGDFEFKISNYSTKLFANQKVRFVYQVVEASDLASGSLTCSEDPEGQHHWRVVAADSKTGAGHYFECALTGCTVKTKLMDHGEFIITKTDPKAEDPDILWKGKTSLPGAVVCPICEYECTHSKKLVDAQAVDGTTYHIGKCPDCGQQIKEHHINDNNNPGTCSVCGQSSALPQFLDQNKKPIDADKALILNVGETYVPQLVIENAYKWEGEFTVSGSSIKIIDETTGEIEAVEPTGGTTYAKLNARLTITPKAGTEEQPETSSTVNVSLNVDVKGVMTKPTITADPAYEYEKSKAYVIQTAEGLNDQREVVHLTLNPGVTNPNLTGYAWKLNTSTADELEFVYMDEETEKWTKATGEKDPTNAANKITEVWVRAKANTGTPLTGVVRVPVQYTATSKATAEILVDVLPPLTMDGDQVSSTYTTCTTLNPVILFDDDQLAASVKELDGDTNPFEIIQTGSAKLRLGTLDEGKFTQFDPRYGSVEWGVEHAETGMTDEDVKSKWLRISGDTVQSLSGTAITSAKTFLVTATITLKEQVEEDGKPASRKVVGKRKIKVVPQPTSVSLYYWTGEQDPTSSTLTSSWKTFDASAKLSVQEGKDFYIMPVVDPATGTISKADVKLTPALGSFTYDANQPLETSKDLEKWVTWEKTNDYATNGYYTFQVKKKGAADSATVSASYSGKTDVTPVTVTVQRVIQSIAMEINGDGMGVGEMIKLDETSSKPASITVSATATPATQDDSITWSLMWVSASGAVETPGAASVPAMPNSFNKVVEAANKAKATSITLEAPGASETTYSRHIVRVQAASKADGTVVAYKDFNLYPAPAATGLSLKVEKNGAVGEASSSSAPTIMLTKNEQTLITEHEYTGTAGASTGKEIRPTIENEVLEGVDDAKGQVATIVEGENGALYVKALKNGGSAELQLTAYNDVHKTIKIQVKPEVDEVVLDKSKITNLKEPVELIVGDTTHPFTVAETAASAYRQSGETKLKDSFAAFTLDADPKGKVDIKWETDKKTWTVTGKEAGSTKLMLRVGNHTSTETIDVNVLQGADGIVFERDGVKITGNQIEIPEGSTEPITIKALVDPANAYGTATFDTPSEVTGFKADLSQDRTELTVTPAENATGSFKVKASVENVKRDPNGGDGDDNPQKIFGHVEFVVVSETGDEPGPEKPPIEIPEDVKIIDKREIGPGETTELAVVGVKAGSDVQWQPAAGSAGVVSIQPSEDKMSAVVTGGATAGTVTVQATLNGGIIGSQVLTVLNKISKLNTTSITLSKNEKREAFCPDFEGYDLNGVLGSDLKNIFHYDYGTATTKNYLTIVNNEDGYTCQIIGKKIGKNCSISVYDYANNLVGTIPVTMTTSNTGFTLGGIENTTQYMKSTDKLLVPVTFKPSKAKIDLEGYVVDDEGMTVEDGSISFDPATLSVVTDGAVGGPYTVVISAPGYEDRMPLHFDVEIVGDAATAENLSVSVDKVGIDDAFEGVDISTGVTVVVGEKLQAKLVDEDGGVVSGATWEKGDTKKYITVSQTGLITAKKAGTTSVKATVAGGQSVSYTIKVVNAPSKSVMQLVPNKTTRKVAYTEDFQLDLMLKKGSYGGQGKYVYIEWTNGMWPEPVKDKAGWYSFSEDTRYFEDDSEDVVATLKTTWGYSSKPVKIHAQGDYAEAIQLPDDIQLPVSGTVTIQPVNAKENEYADLAWTVGTKALTEGKSVKIQSGVTAKLVDGMTLQLTTKKAKVGTTVAISVVANADAENKDDTTATIAATGTLPADAVIAMDKNVIGVGEKITLSMEYPSDDEPVGAVTYKATSAGGKATVKGNVLTGSKPGLVKVSAQLGGASVTKDVYVVAKPVYSYSQKPSKMAVGETISIGVNIDGYDKGAVLPEGFEATTEGLLTEANVTIKDPTMIYVESIDEIKDDDENTPHRYAVKLKADMAKTNSKGAFTSTTVTIAPQGGKKLTAKITVVNDDDLNTIIQNGETPKVRYPEDVYIGVGETITMPGAMIDGTDVPANIDWRFDEPAKAAAAGLSMTTSGQIKADTKTATAGAAIAMSGAVEIDNYYDEENGTTTIELETTLHIGAKVTNKNQFELVMPKTTMGLNEKVQARVNFLNPAVSSGKVTYKSTKTSYATIDKNTGVITGKKVSANKTSIRATVNGKYNQQALTITADPTGVQFAKSVKNVTLDGGTANDLWNDVSLVGGSSKVAEKYKEYETAFRFAIDETKQDNEILADVDAVTGALTFLPNVTNGTAEVTVTTYNGKTDTVMVVLGNGASQGPDEPGPDIPTKDTVPASVELWINGQEKDQSSQNHQVTIQEKSSVKVGVLVKNAAGADITADSKWSWVVSDPKKVSIENDVIKGLATTYEGANANTNTKVIATITVDGLAQGMDLEITVNPVLSGEHLGLFMISGTRDEFPGTFIEGDEVTASSYSLTFKPLYGITSSITSNTYGTLRALTIESSDTTVLNVTAQSYSNGDRVALTNVTVGKPGEATLKMTAKYVSTDGKETLLTNKRVIKVAAQPTADQITITSDLFDENGVLVLAQGEPGSVNISLPADIYGDASGWYNKIALATYAADDTGHKEPLVTSYVSNPSEEPDEGATSAKAEVAYSTTKTAPIGMYDVVVTAYDNTKSTKTFKMQIVKGLSETVADGQYDVKTTPKSQTVTSTETIYAAVGETVKLSIAKKADVDADWIQGLGWWIDTTSTLKGLTLKPDGDGAVTITSSLKGHITVQAILKGFSEPKNTSTSYGTYNSAGRITGTRYTIYFADLPTKDNVTHSQIKVSYAETQTNKDSKAAIQAGTTAGPYTIGVGEIITAKVDFGGSAEKNNQDTYTNDVRWETSATNGDKISWTVEGNTITIKGVAPSDSTVYELKAYTMNGSTKVDLGKSVKVKVVSAPSTLMLKAADGKDFGFTLQNTNPVNVSLKLGTNESATCSMESNSAKLTVTESGHNAWKLEATSTAGATTPVTLTLRSGNKIVRYTVYLKVT